MKPRSAPRRRGPFLVTCGVALWLVASGLCIKALVDFDTTPGVAAAAPTSWPAGVALPRSAGRPTLVLFLHPRCSCSRATLAELERVLTRCPHRAAVDVVFSIPRGVSADSSRNPLWNQAKRRAMTS